MAKNYIGYGSLEEWLGSVDVARPVFANAITDPGNTDPKYGLRTDYARIVCAQPDALGINVHYCRLPVGRWQELAGSVDFAAPQREEAQARLKQVWEMVQAWLKEKGLSVQHAVVAMPRNLKLMDGWAGFIQWDKEAKVYRRVDGQARV